MTGINQWHVFYFPFNAISFLYLLNEMKSITKASSYCAQFNSNKNQPFENKLRSLFRTGFLFQKFLQPSHYL